MEKKFKLEQTAQCVLSIVEALQFYRDNAIKPKYSNVINQQLLDIGEQLNEQGVNIIIDQEESQFKFGKRVKYENGDAIIVGMSNEDYFVKIVIIQNNDLKILDVPVSLLEVEK